MSGMIQVRVPWTKQPPVGTPIDFGNPLAKGLIAYINPVVLREGLKNQTFVTVTAGSDVITGEGGRGRRYTNASSQYEQITAGPGVPVTDFGTRSTMLVVVANVSRTVDSCPWMFNTAADTGVLWGPRFVNVNPDRIQFNIRPSEPTAIWARTASNAVFPSGPTPKVIIGRAKESGDSAQVWVDGADETDTSRTLSAGDATIADLQTLGAESVAGTEDNFFDGDFYLGLAWNRDLSDAEMRNISENPYQVYLPQIKWIPAYVAVAGGVAVLGQLQQSNLGADLYNGTLL